MHRISLLHLPTGTLLADTPVKDKQAFANDLTLATIEVSQGVTDKQSKAAIEHWAIWEMFCGELALDPWLPRCINPVPILQVFMCRVRDGRLAPTGNPVSARHAEIQKRNR